MYLKSLTLKGFKSFADRVHMRFDPGLTVVMGPNGSGKSNISDAVLWVLGEQSAKHLRGQAMEDVVFAGSGGRKAAGLAEVTLVLDNSDHTLPIDFTEIALTRRMYRSGESEYLINAAPARLMDIQDILHDSGLGKETRSIISQGKLDEILTSRSDQRRLLIEEAAGISKHKRRRERSLRKIAQMDEHLKVATRMLGELNRQLRPLQKQVEAAREHQELSARGRELALQLAVDDVRRLQQRWDEVCAAGTDAQARHDACEQACGQAKAAAQELEERYEMQRSLQGDVSQSWQRAQTIHERLHSLVQLLSQKSQNIRGAAARLQSSLDLATRRSQESAQLQQQLEDELAQESAHEAEVLEQMGVSNARVEAAVTARRAVQKELDSLRAEERSLLHSRDSRRTSAERLQGMLANLDAQQEMFSSQAQELDRQIEEALRGAEETQAAADTAAHQLQQIQEELQVAEGQVAGAKAAFEQARLEEAAARSSLSAARAELAALERATQSEENRTPLASRLAADGQARSYAAGRVSELLDVPEELTGVVEGVLAGRARGFVAAGQAGLLQLAARAQELAEDAGQVTLVDGLAAQAQTQAQLPGTEDAQLPGVALLEKVGASGKVPGLAWTLLSGVRLMSCLDEALEASRAYPQLLFVTADGIQVERGSVITVGQAHDVAHGLFALERKLQTVSASLASLEQTHAAAGKAAEAAEQALSDARAARDQLLQERARLSGESRTSAGLADRARAAVEAARAQRHSLEEKTGRQAEEANRTKAQIAELQAELQQVQDRLLELGRDISAQDTGLARLRREEHEARDGAQAMQLRQVRLFERIRSLKTQLKQATDNAAAYRAEETAARESLRRHLAAQEQTAPLEGLLVSIFELAQGYASQTKSLFDAAHQDGIRLRSELEEARRVLSQAQQELNHAAQRVTDVRLVRARLDEQVSQAVNHITVQPGVVLEEALELEAPQNREQAEAELEQIRGRIEQMGPINHVAFQQHADLQARVEHVGAQVSDMRAARVALTRILSAIDKKMRESFFETFETVNRNFAGIFSTLFPGGTGYLELSNPDDPDAMGIEVIAQPKGKRIAKMSLLSGGERSLTALGLLFAVYRTRQVPFYVLDEVEAALDDSNLDRLLGALDVLRRSTQLIVISHQRRTMEKADVLYGVSMQADGVSHVVSQRLEQPAVLERGNA